ncbi:MAG: response regulator [Myxococcales bacterium]
MRSELAANCMAGPHASILVVDDELDVRLTLSEVLQFEGYEVQTAGNGREALECMERGACPAVVLLDLMMPEMNGFEFLQRVRADPRLRKTAIIVLTAFGRMAEKLEAQRLMVEDFLEKPFEFDHLLEAIGHCAENAR